MHASVVRGTLVAGVLGLALAAAPSPAADRVAGASAPPPEYEVYAVRYGTVRAFPVSALIAGVDTSRRQDIAMMVWLLRGPAGRTVLVDAGFHQQKFIDQWKPADYLEPSAALAPLGVRPEDVTDVIISHVHWDHLGGIDLFPRARIWIQREEFEHYVDTAGGGRPRERAIDSVDAAILARLSAAGRVTLVDGDAKEIIPGITVYTGGKHTFASQYAGVHTAAGTVVVASDNMYLYENLATHRPIAQTLDSLSNLRAQDRMRQLAARPELIVPGHDPAVFTRFPSPGNGIARIQ
jgi:glyoxylase-like metal-dependent hydrolase (beta-lactamase superfamily II)